MDLERFKQTIADDAPPPDLDPALVALWHLAKGDWETAHEIAQEVDRREGDWIHAHLHRVEGDLTNAAYWYGRVGRPVSPKSLEEEWDEIAAALLAS